MPRHVSDIQKSGGVFFLGIIFKQPLFFIIFLPFSRPLQCFIMAEKKVSFPEKNKENITYGVLYVTLQQTPKHTHPHTHTHTHTNKHTHIHTHTHKHTHTNKHTHLLNKIFTYE